MTFSSTLYLGLTRGDTYAVRFTGSGRPDVAGRSLGARAARPRHHTVPHDPPHAPAGLAAAAAPRTVFWRLRGEVPLAYDFERMAGAERSEGSLPAPALSFLIPWRPAAPRAARGDGRRDGRAW